MLSDFCVFILSNRRPDRVQTYKTLRGAGYTGRIFIVVDDEDPTVGEYQTRYPGEVLVFCKAEIAKVTDPGDNSGDMRTPLYARNACWGLAEQVGCQHFIQLDDDYVGFEYRYDGENRYGYWRIRSTMDDMLAALREFYRATPALTVAMSQGGDFIGGNQGSPCLRRKAMNSFICSTDRPFKFVARLNDDVTTYTAGNVRGHLFFTVMASKLVQQITQTNAGGLTEAYLDAGTYVKSFFTVMYAPSCTQIGVMGDARANNYRIHHKINWHKAAPKILAETHCKFAKVS